MAIGSKSNRGRPLAMMLLLAFGAAVFGVMVLHKLREKRLFNLLIKEKDRDLASLHLLLQKERDSAKEMKRKFEEMKAKTVSLRTQKMGLTNKLMEMQSVMASLKEDQRTLELAIEERDNKIKTHADKEMNATQEMLQVTTLTELLKRKDAEIEEMKRLLEKPTNEWSVSPDNPSNPPINVTVVENVQAKDEYTTALENATISQEGKASVKVGQYGHKNGMEGRESLSKKQEGKQDGENLSGQEEMGEKNAVEGQEEGEASEGQLVKRPEESESGEGFVARSRKGPRNVTEDNEQTAISRDGKLDAVEVKYQGGSGDGQPERLQNSPGGELEEQGAISEKLEMLKRSRDSSSSRIRGRQGYRIKLQNKRQRAISTEGASENQNSSDSENMKLRSESGDKDAAKVESQKAGMRDVELKKIEQFQYGDGNAMDVLGVNDEEGAASNDKRPEMPTGFYSNGEGLEMRYESGDKNSLGGDEQLLVSNEGQLEVAIKSSGEDSRMISERMDENVVKQFELQKAVSSYGQMEIAKNSRGDKNMLEGKEKEVVSHNGHLKVPENFGDGQNSPTRTENDDENTLEVRESEAVSNNVRLEMTNNARDSGEGDRVASEVQDKKSISRDEQSQEPQDSKGRKGLRMIDETSDPNEQEEKEQEMASEDRKLKKIENNRYVEGGNYRDIGFASDADGQETTGIKTTMEEKENLNPGNTSGTVEDHNIAKEAKYMKRSHRRKKVKRGGRGEKAVLEE